MTKVTYCFFKHVRGQKLLALPLWVILRNPSSQICWNDKEFFVSLNAEKVFFSIFLFISSLKIANECIRMNERLEALEWCVSWVVAFYGWLQESRLPMDNEVKKTKWPEGGRKRSIASLVFEKGSRTTWWSILITFEGRVTHKARKIIRIKPSDLKIHSVSWVKWLSLVKEKVFN